MIAPHTRPVNIPWEKPPWMGEAACRGADQKTFFPERGASLEPARRICAPCPVFDLCRDYALARPGLLGVWGGLSQRERRRLRYRQRRAA